MKKSTKIPSSFKIMMSITIFFSLFGLILYYSTTKNPSTFLIITIGIIFVVYMFYMLLYFDNLSNINKYNIIIITTKTNIHTYDITSDNAFNALQKVYILYNKTVKDAIDIKCIKL